jgi:hypothetical protein
MEKISVAILTAQELIISIVYLLASVRILRIGESVQRKGNRRRIWLLLLANVAIIAIDISTITLEFMALWGVWCSFKGFGYSVKLKIEFAILNQLRDSVKGNTSDPSYDLENSSRGNGLSLRSRTDANTKSASRPGRLSMKRQNFEQISDAGQIQKKTEIDVRMDDRVETKGATIQLEDFGRRDGAHLPPSESSSEIEFASKGV